MMDMRSLFKKLLFPFPWLLLPLTLISAASLIFIFTNGYDMHPAAYLIYALSAYTVTVLTLYFVKVFPHSYNRIKQRLYAHPSVKRFFTEPAFKTHVLLYTSFTTNLLYALMNGIFAAVLQTAWFAVFAGYYALLAVMRFLLLRYVEKHAIRSDLIAEWQRAKVCAYVLICINLSLSVAVFMMLRFGRTFSYPGLLIYVMAAYTFYMTTIAVINLIRYRRHGSPVMSFAKIVTMASALVSMLALETAMLEAFGAQTDTMTKHALIGATGLSICLTIIVMSIYTILQATKAQHAHCTTKQGDTHQ